MNIAFTGHRNKEVGENDLMVIYNQFPDSTWIHGGAKGFDTQVSEFATRYNIEQVIIRPDYTLGRAAPLIRNRIIINQSRLLVACYDGRTTGGTFYTVNYAKKQGLSIHTLSPV